jgi:hypothetical protein
MALAKSISQGRSPAMRMFFRWRRSRWTTPAVVHRVDGLAEPLEDAVGQLSGLELVDGLPVDVLEKERPLLDDLVGAGDAGDAPRGGAGRRTPA